MKERLQYKIKKEEVARPWHNFLLCHTALACEDQKCSGDDLCHYISVTTANEQARTRGHTRG